jgi:uncharacterized protein (DUF58 family)
VRLAAAIVSRFADQNASIRLVIGEDIGELATGRGHVHECFKRLAIAEPVFETNDFAKTESDISRVLTETENSHRFFVTPNKARPISLDNASQLKVVEF